MDILINTNPIDPGYGDAVWRNGPLRKEETTQLFTQTVAQRLKIRLQTFREEWFLDVEYGVPYWQRILGLKNTKEAVDLIFQQEILKETGVKEIVSFESTFENRNYSLVVQVKVVNGEITQPIVVQPIN